MYYIYQRISTDKQSLTRQEGAIEDYCKSNNIDILPENVYSDIITGKTIKRENYQVMKSKLQKDYTKKCINVCECIDFINIKCYNSNKGGSNARYIKAERSCKTFKCNGKHFAKVG